MSHSRRRRPIRGICGGSEKDDKRIWHGQLRAKERVLERDARRIETHDILCDYPGHRQVPDYDVVWPLPDDVSDPWSMTKDGKSYWGWDWPCRQMLPKPWQFYGK